MIALFILAALFCAMALLGLVRLVKELLLENPIEAPSIGGDSAPRSEPQADAAPQTAAPSR